MQCTGTLLNSSWNPKKLIHFIWQKISPTEMLRPVWDWRLKNSDTEEVIWMSDDTFLPLKTLYPDEQNQLFGISLPEWLSMHQDIPLGIVSQLYYELIWTGAANFKNRWAEH